MAPQVPADIGRLIAERTLAVAGATPEASSSERRRGRLALAAVLVLAAGAGVAALAAGRRGPAPADSAASPADSGPASAGPAGQAGTATLTINAWPTANVYLDGRRLAQSTPIKGLAVAPGAHTVVLVSKDGTLRKELPLTLQAGDARTMVLNLDR